MSYPTTIPTFTARADGVDYPQAADINELQVNLSGVMNALDPNFGGTTPAQGDILYRSASGEWTRLAAGTSGYVLSTQGAAANPQWIASAAAAGLPAGHLFGLGLANNVTDAVNDIDIAAGKARDSTDAVDMVLAAGLTKRLDAAWAVGTNQGGLDTGAVANATYHVWKIKRSDTGVTDVLFSLSASAPTMPTSYDYKRRIGSIIRAGATILAFTQHGDLFYLNVPVVDVNVATLGTSSTTYTLASVPTGLALKALFTAYVFKAATFVQVWIRALTQTDAAVSYNTNANATDPSAVNGSNNNLEIMTNASAQIAARSTSATTTLLIITRGWEDTRGK